MILKKYDKEAKFKSIFDTETGMYMRTGVLDENGKDTGTDPFKASFPELIDVGIMGHCVCAEKCNVDCYQRAIDKKCNPNMPLKSFKQIVDQCKDKCYQYALGGAGDVDTHEEFEEILKYCRDNNIVPNFTTSGIALTKEKIEICKKYCGAIAVSEHFTDYTEKALNMLIEAGITTNIHYVLSNKTIDDAINKLKNDGFKKGINAVVFLLYKPVGLGKEENVLRPEDPRVKEFFSLVENNKCSHQIGFDSCTCAGIVNFTKNIDLNSIDYCEGGRFSCYIDANMNMMPCSFANQNPSWFTSLNNHTIEEVWNGKLFDKFRYSLKHSCEGCKNRDMCAGGCPIVNQITLCDRTERDFIERE